MSNYIFNPPPPPPPKATAPLPPPQTGNQWNNSPQGGGGRGRGGRGGRGGQQNRGGYNQPYRGGRGGRRGYQNQDHFPHPHPQQAHTQNIQQQQQQSFPQYLPSAPSPAPYINPAFFPQLVQQRPSHLPQRPLHPLPPTPLQTAPLNPLFPQRTPAAPVPSQYQPSLGFTPYGNITTPNVPLPYAHFSAATALPPHKPRLAKPDMSYEEWVALNGGKLLGTNIKPPETDEEIAAWIAERKARFPSAKRREEMAKEQEERKKRIQGEEERRKLDREKRKEKAAEEKRKREDVNGEDAGDDSEGDADDGPPEEISALSRTVVRDDRKKGPAPAKHVPVCKTWRKRGSCPRGEECRFRHPEKHEQEKKKMKGERRQKSEQSRLSLYQRLVEKEMDCENELLLEVIKYMVEIGAIQQDGGGDRDGKNDEETMAVAAEEPLTESVDDGEDEEIEDVGDNGEALPSELEAEIEG